VPLEGFRKRHDERFTVEDLVALWELNAGFNVAITTGRLSGLVCVDVDDQGGDEELLRVSRGHLPPTLKCFTPGGGYHLLYALPPGLELRTTSFPTGSHPVHILCEGSIIVMPPSRNPDGKPYFWAPESDGGKRPPAAAPDWVLGDIRPRLKPSRRKTVGTSHSSRLNGQTGGLSPVERARLYARKCDPAISGQNGHNQTFKVACRIFDIFKLSPDDAFIVLWEEYNPRCKEEWTEAELRHKVEDAFKAERNPQSEEYERPTPTARARPKPPAESAPAAVANKKDAPFITAEELRQLPVDWLLRGFLAMGTFALLTGSKERGKSTLSCAIAADVTGGPRLPGEEGGPRVLGSVLVFAPEDDHNRTTKGRLVAAGADLTRVYFPREDQDGVAGWSPILPADAGRLEAEIRKYGAKVVFLDPLTSAFAGGYSTNDEQQVREVLELLVRIARRTGCLILGTRHPNKSTSQTALNRTLGSVAFNNVPRSALLVDKHPTLDKHFALTVVACNLCQKPLGLAYRLEDSGGFAKLVWAGTVDADPDEMGGPAEEAGVKGKIGQACRFLMLELADEPKPCQLLYATADQSGISERTLDRAKKFLGVEQEWRRVNGKHTSVWLPPEGGFPDLP